MPTSCLKLFVNICKLVFIICKLFFNLTGEKLGWGCTQAPFCPIDIQNGVYILQVGFYNLKVIFIFCPNLDKMSAACFLLGD